MINRRQCNVDLQLPMTGAPSAKVKSLDLLLKEQNKGNEPLDMKEFGFMVLYNDWMQTTLLSDGLTEEDQVKW